MTRAFVIGRIRKGRHVRRTARQVRRLLEDSGWRVDGKVVRRKPKLRRLGRRAARAGCDVVVAVGGDGTVTEIASALADRDTELGIVPLGTGNLLAGNLGVPRDPAKAVRTILGRETRRIDLGRATFDTGTHRDFAVACGVGWDADVVGATRVAQKRRWGQLAYIANAIGMIGDIRNVACDLTLDGVRTSMPAAQVYVANVGRAFPGIEPRMPIDPEDGMLDVVVVQASGPVQGLLAGWDALRQSEQGLDASGRSFRARAREVRIQTRPERGVEADGNVIGRTPVVVAVLPGALRVIAPPRHPGKRRPHG